MYYLPIEGCAVFEMSPPHVNCHSAQQVDFLHFRAAHAPLGAPHLRAQQHHFVRAWRGGRRRLALPPGLVLQRVQTRQGRRRSGHKPAARARSARYIWPLVLAVFAKDGVLDDGQAGPPPPLGLLLHIRRIELDLAVLLVRSSVAPGLGARLLRRWGASFHFKKQPVATLDVALL
jgi:hypothetical protein